jgi:hypothetical protein
VNADPVPKGIDKDLVTFIFRECDPTNPIGTGFYVGVPTKTLPNVSTRYLVTAKHVLSDPGGKLLSGVFLRMEGTKDTFFNLHLPFEGSCASSVCTNSDPSVDIAVVPLAFDGNSAKTRFLPVALIASRGAFTKLDIRAGEEMFFLGLFTPFYGSKHNLPIFRFGRLSMLPDEKIPFAGGEQDLILMESQVFGGNSGSPCFFYFDERRNPNDTKLFLAGVVKGYFRDWSEVKVVETRETPISERNVGIAAIIPAYYILDILNCSTLQQFRDYAEEVVRGQQGTNTAPTSPEQQKASKTK